MLDFWNFSTSVRNPERLPDFLKIAAQLKGLIWNSDSQEKFQILLIQNRMYLNSDNTQSLNNLSDVQKSWLIDKTHILTFEEAKSIFISKRYKDPAMRGRQSMNPLKKLGYMVAEKDEVIKITEIGSRLLSGEISFEEALLESLLKYQLPNEITEGCSEWNSKPFISTLRLIKKVNELCVQKGTTPKGISLDEFGIFALTMLDFRNIDITAKKILEYRTGYDNIKQRDFPNYRSYKKEKDHYKKTFISEYLAKFNNPIKNVKEYGDSMKRYLRQTKYIRFLGAYGNQCIDLEPRRMIEIESILDNDTGQSLSYNKDGWISYIGSQGNYVLPFETISNLSKILNNIISENEKLETKLSLEHKVINIPTQKFELKKAIAEAREYRTLLQNKEIKFEYNRDISKIDTAIEMLGYISTNKTDMLINKPSVELEKWANIALNIINDAISIKPNAPVGDDNEPTYTAPANMPDIECYYGSFSMICEVTMLRNRDQWFNEGQPVMRHLRDFEDKNITKPNYCLFVAPALHQDTLGTYWNAVKYEYDGMPQKIIPITIKQLTEILAVVKELKISGKNICKENMIDFYNRCVDLTNCRRSSEWPAFISSIFEVWKNSLLQ